MSEFLILQKKVDMSVLREGMSIPVAFQDIFYEKLGFYLRHDEQRAIRIRIGSEVYDATLKNGKFDRRKYAGHTDLLQIRYSPNSPLAVRLREIFAATQTLTEEFRAERTGRERLSIPEEKAEYLVLYATPVEGEILADCITRGEYAEAAEEIRQADEFSCEAGIDSDAGIVLRPGLRKVRKLTRAIGDSLKPVYRYRCQICGQSVGEPYGSNLIHAHHIDYFTRSLNNNADNILIVCPNHHGIIHDRNPVFDRKTLTYTYPNGYREGLLLNEHLRG